MSQKIKISEIGVGVLSSVVSLMNVKKVAKKFVYVIENMERLIYEFIFRKYFFLCAIIFCSNFVDFYIIFVIL